MVSSLSRNTALPDNVFNLAQHRVHAVHAHLDPGRPPRRAEQAGFHAIVQTVPTDSGTLHKVYVNPKLDRAEAQALAAQVEKKLAVKGYVTRYYP